MPLQQFNILYTLKNTKEEKQMKKSIILFWKGLTGIISATAEWFTVILGMKDESRYGIFIRRVVGGSFAFIMFVIACSAGHALYKWVYQKVNAANNLDGSCSHSQYLSRNATYNSRPNQIDGYVETRDGKKTVTGIHWISKPLGYDSLVCYSNGETRGYFNMLTGEIAIKPQYKHAWVFSDGLASVDDNGMIKFIDAKGNVVIDLNIPYITGAEGYVFHNGYCVIHGNKRDKYGLIDKKGHWKLTADYDAIATKDTFIIVSKGGKQSVLTESLKTVVPPMEASLWIVGSDITATMKDHTLRRYNLQGELTDDFLIRNVFRMMYDTNEIRYTTAPSCDDDGNQTEEAVPTPYQKIASCKKYEAEEGWYGLMSPNGKIITPPRYCDITAIGHDLYLCKTDDVRGEMLNSKGQKVR